LVATLSFNGKELAVSQALSSPRFNYYETGQNVLLSPIILKNANVLIRGDNLEALKFISKLNFKFNIIYIDPPYNSGLKFTYNDLFKKIDGIHSEDSWLCMMMPRLILAHKVLSEDGVIFISIDDRENSNLTVIMREIFGKENHIGTLKWRKKNKPSFLDKHLGSVIEYVLIFSKNKNKLLKLIAEKSTELSRPVLNASNSLSKRLLKINTEAKCPDGTYFKGIYTNRTLKIELENDAIISNGKLINEVTIKGKFRVSQNILDDSVFITRSFGLRRKISLAEHSYRHATDDATVDFESNEDAEMQLKNLFNGEKIFDFPKPVGLLKNIIKMYQKSNNDTIHCLDFFAGSATIAHTIYELNLQEGFKYSFCCIQSEEKINKKSIYSEIESVADIAQQRIKIVEDKYKIFPRCKIFTPISQNDE
jgi:adenine-specific DNA-methyltransferase